MKRLSEQQIDQISASVTATLLEAAPGIHPLDVISVIRSALMRAVHVAPSEKIKRQIVDQSVLILRSAIGPKQDPAFKEISATKQH